MYGRDHEEQELQRAHAVEIWRQQNSSKIHDEAPGFLGTVINFFGRLLRQHRPPFPARRAIAVRPTPPDRRPRGVLATVSTLLSSLFCSLFSANLRVTTSERPIRSLEDEKRARRERRRHLRVAAARDGSEADRMRRYITMDHPCPHAEMFEVSGRLFCDRCGHGSIRECTRCHIRLCIQCRETRHSSR